MTGHENGNLAQDRRFGTLAVHAGAPHDPTTGAVIAPVSQSVLESNGVSSNGLTILDFPLHDVRADQRRQSRRSLRIHTEFQPESVCRLLRIQRTCVSVTRSN